MSATPAPHPPTRRLHRLHPALHAAALVVLLTPAALLACGADDPAEGPQGNLARAGATAAEEAPARAQSRPEPPVTEGRTEQRLADTGEVPLALEDDCGLDAPGKGASPVDPGRAAHPESPWIDPITFAVQFGDEVNPHRLMSAFVMPGESLEIEPTLTGRNSVFEVRAEAGRVEKTAQRRWTWTAPEEPGRHCIQITDTTANETMCLNAFVLTPYDGGERLNGYRIGQYPDELFRGLERYRAPAGMVEVTAENQDTWVSPHFQLKQFVCKQESGFPKYLVLDTRLLLKLERLLQEVNDAGIPAESFYVMSAYRTPFYNRAIGNTTTFSRHTFGDAADIFIDRNRNGVMDDLSGDGEVTVADAKILQKVVEGLYDEPWYRPFVGGLGLYGPTAVRGPFIHVDTRGYRARW